MEGDCPEPPRARLSRRRRCAGPSVAYAATIHSAVTASTKRGAGLSPRLTAIAVASEVLGPGVKPMAVARRQRAVNSVRGMKAA